MGIFKKITKGFIDTCLLPLDVTKDIVSLPDSEKKIGKHTINKLKKLKDRAEDIYDSLDED